VSSGGHEYLPSARAGGSFHGPFRSQKDEKEKAHQVSSMPKIYGLAQHVIVWFGEEADDSAFVFQELREAAFKADDMNHVEFGKIKRSTSMAEDVLRRERREHASLSLL
jgi:hypothetical protein